MDSGPPDEELVEVRVRLPRSVRAEIERLVPAEQRETFYRNAVEWALLLQENSE